MRHQPALLGDPYAVAVWLLLGRHPRLDRLADRVTGLVHHDPEASWINLDRFTSTCAVLNVPVTAVPK